MGSNSLLENGPVDPRVAGLAPAASGSLGGLSESAIDARQDAGIHRKAGYAIRGNPQPLVEQA